MVVHGDWMNRVFWNRKVQKASVDELKSLQLKLLKRQVAFAYQNSRFYHRRFRESGVGNPRIRSLEDVRKLPFTSREDLERNFWEVLAVPYSRVSTLRLSSGSTGFPLAIAHTQRDIANYAEASARKLTYHGVTGNDVVQVTSTYGLWQGAWSVHWGAEKIGACVIPVGAGDTERQIRIIRQFKSTVLYGVTNYHLRIAEVAKALGEDLRSHKLWLGVCVAEKPSKQQIETLKSEFGYAKVAIDYGATEFPGFSVQCECSDYHHVWGDYYLIEAVNPDTHEPCEDGEKGEIAITSLQRQAFPLIRYLSRDVTSFLDFGKCECGMSHPKLGLTIDREDFMTKIRGVAVFPTQIETMLSESSELTSRCQIIVDKRTPQHVVSLKVETNDSLSETGKRSLTRKIVEEVKNRIGITLNDVTFVPSGSFETKYKKSIVVTN
jgi:phenylacetate-CoA ligase